MKPTDQPKPEILLVYDTRGNLAGMHSVVFKDDVADSMKHWFTDSIDIWYQDGDDLIDDTWITTAYFMDPADICTSRPNRPNIDREFGDRLWVKYGEANDGSGYDKIPKLEKNLNVS